MPTEYLQKIKLNKIEGGRWRNKSFYFEDTQHIRPLHCSEKQRMASKLRNGTEREKQEKYQEKATRYE